VHGGFLAEGWGEAKRLDEQTRTGMNRR
jgi:hypothetical protein